MNSDSSDTPHEPEYSVYYRRNNRDHITKDGEVFCSSRVRNPKQSDLKPVDELTEREISLLTSDTSGLCIYCQGFASRKGLFAGTESTEIPDFPCPKCGEPASIVGTTMGNGYVEHSNGERHEIDFSAYERWRRGEDTE